MEERMIQPKLAVIVPYVQEWPQIAFTLRAIHEELLDYPHEIIAVDNMCGQAYNQMIEMGTVLDRGHDRIQRTDGTFVPGDVNVPENQVKERHQSAVGAQAKYLPWLTYLKFDEKLSHWGAKRAACLASDADFFLFCDSHVSPARGSLSGMYATYTEQWRELGGSLHAPLSYHILEEKKLIYKLVYERGLLGYSFTGYREPKDFMVIKPGIHIPKPYEVPVMSTCGMMIHREFLEHVGGWPEELGIYGGGENFMNAAMAVTGLKKWIMPGPALHHHGDKRGYHWEWLDHKRNQAIAMYLAGGEQAMWDYMKHLKPFKDRPEVFSALSEDIMTTCHAQRNWIKERQTTTIDEWVETWKE
jgi:hypothetical protein